MNGRNFGLTIKFPICSRMIFLMMLFNPGASKAFAIPPRSKSISGDVKK
jgi:hypothetical protein